MGIVLPLWHASLSAQSDHRQQAEDASGCSDYPPKNPEYLVTGRIVEHEAQYDLRYEQNNPKNPSR
jgi:hypothetical protein